MRGLMPENARESAIARRLRFERRARAARIWSCAHLLGGLVGDEQFHHQLARGDRALGGAGDHHARLRGAEQEAARTPLAPGSSDQPGSAIAVRRIARFRAMAQMRDGGRPRAGPLPRMVSPGGATTSRPSSSKLMPVCAATRPDRRPIPCPRHHVLQTPKHATKPASAQRRRASEQRCRPRQDEPRAPSTLRAENGTRPRWPSRHNRAEWRVRNCWAEDHGRWAGRQHGRSACIVCKQISRHFRHGSADRRCRVPRG